MNQLFFERQKKASMRLAEDGIFAAVIKDAEGSRNSSLRYLTGHPQDALLFIFADSDTILLPWDVNLANEKASCSSIIPYTDYNRNYFQAAEAVLSKKITRNSRISRDSSGAAENDKLKIEVSASSSWLDVNTLRKKLPDMEIICRDNGIDAFLSSSRKIKDNSELQLYTKAAEITDNVINELEEYLQKNIFRDEKRVTEADIAMKIERLARDCNAEGTGFETIAASGGRSWAIHPWPAYSSSQVTGSGLTIIDFGIRYKGYTTDVTLTAAGKNLSDKQKEMIQLVQNAAELAEKELKPGISAGQPAQAVNIFFKSHGYAMPHSLGHGIGLDVHEAPLLKNDSENTAILEPGMVLAVEPGLYDPDAGGVRLENDFIITSSGCTRITSSRIIFPEY